MMIFNIAQVEDTLKDFKRLEIAFQELSIESGKVFNYYFMFNKSIVAKWLALLTGTHQDLSSNPVNGKVFFGEINSLVNRLN